MNFSNRNEKTQRAVTRRAVLRYGTMAAAAIGLCRAGSAFADQNSIPQVRLNNGVMMPRLGFGTYSLRGERCTASVADAIATGYRLIDTAKVYENEEAVGEGIRQSGVDRKRLFVTSKIWVEDSGYEPAKKAFQITLDKLQLEYLDLYLIHRPRGDVKNSWRAMEELNVAGKIRAIGVSNFDQTQLAELLATAKVKPVLNQVETHPYFQEKDLYASLGSVDVQLEAWAPFAEGRGRLFSDAILSDIASKHGKSVAQVVLRWHYQRGVISIPRSSNPTHRRENLAIFDFQLSPDDMRKISVIDKGVSQFPEWT